MLSPELLDPSLRPSSHSTMDFPRTPRRVATSRDTAQTPRRLNSNHESDFPRTPLRRVSTSALESNFPRTPRSEFIRTPWRRSGQVDFQQTPRPRQNPPRQQPQTKSALPHRLVVLLNDHFKSRDDLWKATFLQSQINGECLALEKAITELKEKVSQGCMQWRSRSEEFGRVADGFGSMLPESQGGNVEKMVRIELPNLAKEVCRIQTIQLYAEKALKLEVMVGNLEDSASTIVRRTSTNKSFLGFQHVPNFNDSRRKQEKLLDAINVMKEIEQELIEICTTRPEWSNLVKAVDSRVENALSILRPQSLSDYRALLASLCWPPPLVTSQTETINQTQLVPNPLLLMDSTKREIYSQSFLALCALQHVQSQRNARQSMKEEKLQKSLSFESGLWAIDELVQPIATRMEHHFAKWSSQPEFIFALVFKITKDFMDGVDDVLQPLIDKARLSGLSAKEAWVSSMVKVLLGYLEKEIFPSLANKFHENKDESIEFSSSWLNLIDLIISFDKRMRVLSSSGIQKITSLIDLNETISKSVSVLSVFDEHLDWLQIWAEIEVSVAQEKLKPELENEKCWSYEIKDQAKIEEHHQKFLLSTREEYKAPPIVDAILKNASLMIERGHAVPTKSTKIEFFRKSGVLFLNHFFVLLLQRCRDLELITSAIDEDALVTIAGSINAARYFESVISEWDEDISFMDLNSGDRNKTRSFFSDEVLFLVKLETDCLEEVMSAILLEFEALSYDYIQNIDQWEDEGEPKIDFSEDDLENGTVSLGFMEALEILRDRILKLKDSLNSKDFFDLWRSVAEGLDYFIFSSIPWIDVRFSNSGVYQFRVDMRAVFLVFKPLCARPEAFFPFVSDCLRLLSMNKEDVDWFLRELTKNECRLKEWMHQKNLYHVNGSQAKMILVDRNFEE
ncbi:RINT1-like protein MAG2L [Rhynchospora pubera]|uniref:RINT1-like protein MAG2L n=1 Tax=Rhynchospora pubera TaxID=906938 RepID=A0AAV8HLE7_9POAL|nr:RINT1-like protein MAG2L [Rhynchospora pubera]